LRAFVFRAIKRAKDTKRELLAGKTNISYQFSEIPQYFHTVISRICVCLSIFFPFRLKRAKRSRKRKWIYIWDDLLENAFERSLNLVNFTLDFTRRDIQIEWAVFVLLAASKPKQGGESTMQLIMHELLSLKEKIIANNSIKLAQSSVNCILKLLLVAAILVNFNGAQFPSRNWVLKHLDAVFTRLG
jgi:hypothetical protein